MLKDREDEEVKVIKLGNILAMKKQGGLPDGSPKESNVSASKDLDALYDAAAVRNTQTSGKLNFLSNFSKTGKIFL
jgi:hypothetical protein